MIRVRASIAKQPGPLILDRDGSPASLSALDDWQVAMRINVKDWQNGRSAKELARHWTDSESGVPHEVLKLLRSGSGLRGLKIGSYRAEFGADLDGGRGPARLDLVALGHAGQRRVLVAVEAKTSESFGPTLQGQYGAALRKTNKVKRLDGLTERLFDGRHLMAMDEQLAGLRYQLLTFTAGSVEAADELGAERVVMLVHEFHHAAVAAKDRQRNRKDFKSFLELFNAGLDDISRGGITGPVSVEARSGTELPLYVAKLTTELAGSFPRPTPRRRKRRQT